MLAASMMLAATSCSQEEDFAPVQSGEMTTFQVNLEGVSQSRAVVADGLTATELHCEVYQNNKKVLDNLLSSEEENVASPTIKALGAGKFEVSMPLLRGEYYDILFWAQAPAESSIYDPTHLTYINVNYANAKANQEAYDAFFYGEKGFRVTSDETKITLTRPFAQLNVGTTRTDWEQACKVIGGDITVPVTHSEVHVTGLATHFNVLEGLAFGDEGANGNQVYQNATFNQDVLVDQYFKAKDNEYYYLAMNYLLVPGKVVKNDAGEVIEEAKSTTDVTATFYRGQDNELFSIGKLPTVSIQRNWRTNILGNLLADPKTFIIEIDKAFENDVNKEIEIYADGIVKDENGFYHITKVEGLWAFANWVNTGYTQGEGRAATDDHTFKGQTIYLDCDIDLENKAWTPISNFQGTFDGQDNTISNLSVSVEGKASAGLFANCMGYIQNLKVNNAGIKGHYRAGVIVGNGLCSRIENCHVDGATVTITPLDNDDANHAGGIVGYLSAEKEAYVKGCSVKNATITAYRDVAAIAGTATTQSTNPEVSGNTVENVTVIADQTNEYKEVKVANVDAIVGRRHQNATIENNTIGENVEFYVLVNTAANAQFQAENATGDFLIKFGEDIEGDVMIQQKENVNITIDGSMSKKYDGTIKIHNGSNYNNGTLLIKNVAFETSVASHNFIMPNDFGVENGVTRRYSQNVIVDGCTFTATGDAKNTAVGVQAKSCKNLQVLNCTATDMHSLLQAQSCDENVVVKNATINGKNGVAFKQVKNAVVEGSTIVAAEYGIRFDGNTDNYGITVKDNDVTANQPFIVRKMTGQNNTIVLEGDNTLTAGETFQIVITKGNDDETYSTPTGTYTLTGAENFKVYPRDATGYAKVCNVTDLNAALDNSGIKTIELGAGEFGTIVAKSGKTIIGSVNAKVDAVNLNGADNVTLKNINFDAAKAIMGYDGKGKAKQYANIITGSSINKPNNGTDNLIIEGCTFTGKFADGGVTIAFTDQGRTNHGGQSGNITIKGCTFSTENAYCHIYTHYSGKGNFIIEENIFETSTYDKPIYLGRYQSSTPVVVKGNVFKTVATFEDAAYIQAHSTNYTVSFDESEGNTFGE